jgi:hypothetical protein
MSPVIAGGKIIEGSQPFCDKTASFTIGEAKISRVTASAAVTATLPTAADYKDREFTVVRVTGSTHDVTVTDGASLTYDLTGDNEEITAYSNGSGWVWRA